MINHVFTAAFLLPTVMITIVCVSLMQHDMHWHAIAILAALAANNWISKKIFELNTTGTTR